MSAREEILGRIRTALGPQPQVPGAVPRNYRYPGGVREPGDGQGAGGQGVELLDLLTDRLVDYRAEVVTCSGGDDAIARTVSQVLRDKALRSIVAPPAAARRWLQAGMPAHGQGDEELQVVEDDGRLGPAELDTVDAVVTGSGVVVAETGTIVLDGSEVCGRRAITLVPDVHVCVVRREQVVRTVPEAVARLDPLRPLTMIAGPSATSDIELDRVEGVHGPRTLIVVLAS